MSDETAEIVLPSAADLDAHAEEQKVAEATAEESVAPARATADDWLKLARDLRNLQSCEEAAAKLKELFA